AIHSIDQLEQTQAKQNTSPLPLTKTLRFYDMHTMLTHSKQRIRIATSQSHPPPNKKEAPVYTGTSLDRIGLI
ncbi:MAG: hypothetical protein ACXVOI_08700, partial [Tumebacillaceae bacterium]